MYLQHTKHTPFPVKIRAADLQPCLKCASEHNSCLPHKQLRVHRATARSFIFASSCSPNCLCPHNNCRAFIRLSAGYICNAGIGTFQSRQPDMPYTLVPGDVAFSIILASVAHAAAGQGSQNGPNITHSCTSCSNPITLQQLIGSICQYYR